MVSVTKVYIRHVDLKLLKDIFCALEIVEHFSPPAADLLLKEIQTYLNRELK